MPLMVALLVLVEVRLLHARVGYSTSAQRRATASFAATHLLLPVPQVVLLVEPAARRRSMTKKVCALSRDLVEAVTVLTLPQWCKWLRSIRTGCFWGHGGPTDMLGLARSTIELGS